MRRILACLIFACASALSATDNCSNLPVAATLSHTTNKPVMGWDSWYVYNTGTTETNAKAQADALVSTGLFDVGYQYINLDDGWEAAARVSGNLVANATRFPSGMASLVTYVHGKGEKFGLYSSPYLTTCSGFPGSGTFEAADATTFSSWGVDYLKYDGCDAQVLYPSCFATSGKQIYQWMAQLARAASHPFTLTVGCVPNGCPAGGYSGNWAPAYLWAADEGYGDSRVIYDDYNGIWATWDRNIDVLASIPSYGGPGNHPSVDFLGVSPFSDNAKQTQFVMAAMWSSPLILSIDLTTITAPQLAIYKNTAVIAVDQDDLGLIASRVSQSTCGTTSCDVWVKPLSDGSWAIALLNRDTLASHTITFSLQNFGVNPDVHDLLAGTDLGNLTSLSATPVALGIAVYKVIPAARTNPVVLQR